MDRTVLLSGPAAYTGGRLLRSLEEGGQARPQDVLETFTYCSILPGSATDVFGWHERPEALPTLLPSGRLIRIDGRTGGIRDGDCVALSFGLGPLRIRWHARHFGYVPDREFSDEQLRGPFSVWRHTHRVEPRGPAQCVYEDRVQYALKGGPLVQRVMRPLLRALLARSFARRHWILRRIFVDARDSWLRASQVVTQPQQPRTLERLTGRAAARGTDYACRDK